MNERKEGGKKFSASRPGFDWEDHRFRCHGTRTLLWLLNDGILAEPLDLAETGMLDKETQRITSRSAKALF